MIAYRDGTESRSLTGRARVRSDGEERKEAAKERIEERTTVVEWRDADSMLMCRGT